MSNCNSSNEIQHLPLSTKEEYHRSRKRIEYHIYLSNFFKQFTLLNDEKKGEELVKLGIWSKSPEDESIDSILTRRQVQVHDIIKVARRN